MEGLSKEFKELKESFQELKAENAILRKEILGIGSSAASSGEKGMGLMEKTTLRELVEEIQFDVKALNAKVERNLQEECSGNGNKPSGGKRGDLDLPYADNHVDPLERFPVVDINFKTIEEQRDWMKKIFGESVEQRSVSEGASFGGRTLQVISSAIVPNPDWKSTSCTMKLSNHLSYALTDPRFHFYHGIKTSGPSKVDPHFSEVFALQGSTDLGHCQFLCSFGLSSSLRLTIYSDPDIHGSIELGIAFTPQDVRTDEDLYDKLRNITSAPDIWMHRNQLILKTQSSKMPMEVIIHHGKLHLRGHMTPGPFSIIYVDIMEVSDTQSVHFPLHTKMQPLENGESISATMTSTNLHQGSTWYNFTCIVEIGNCLKYTLKNPSAYFCKPAHNDFFPSEIRPFCRQRFLASHNNCLQRTVGGIFSYEIESTDLCLVVAFQAESGNNSFAVAFDQLPVEANRKELGALMDTKAWKTHLYKKYAHAKYGEQVIGIRNIRASVQMTDADAESLLMIRVFAV